MEEGCRGIVPGVVLSGLENKLIKATGNDQTRLADYFDFFAGTSTGGIISCGLLIPDDNNPARPKYKAEDLVNMYMNWGGDIFHIPFFHRLRSAGGVVDEKYPATGIEEAMRTYFGDCELKHLLRQCLITS